MFAGLLSAIYGLVMMAVLVGIMLQISDDGWLAPSSLFFFVVAGEMVITALMHPKEVQFLKYGVVYYVTVPSMYMLLVIYSVFNMNNVSWGTREVTVVQNKTNAPVSLLPIVTKSPIPRSFLPTARTKIRTCVEKEQNTRSVRSQRQRRIRVFGALLRWSFQVPLLHT